MLDSGSSHKTHHDTGPLVSGLPPLSLRLERTCHWLQAKCPPCRTFTLIINTSRVPLEGKLSVCVFFQTTKLKTLAVAVFTCCFSPFWLNLSLLWLQLSPFRLSPSRRVAGDQQNRFSRYFFAYKKCARSNWDANSWEEWMTVDTNDCTVWRDWARQSRARINVGECTRREKANLNLN